MFIFWTLGRQTIVRENVWSKAKKRKKSRFFGFSKKNFKKRKNVTVITCIVDIYRPKFVGLKTTLNHIVVVYTTTKAIILHTLYTRTNNFYIMLYVFWNLNFFWITFFTFFWNATSKKRKKSRFFLFSINVKTYSRTMRQTCDRFPVIQLQSSSAHVPSSVMNKVEYNTQRM